MRSLSMLVGVMLVSASSMCMAVSGNILAHVTHTGIFGTGDLFVDIDQTINEPACPSGRLMIAANNPQLKYWLSIAMEAYAMNSPVRVQTNGVCYNGMPTLDSTGGFFHLTNQ